MGKKHKFYVFQGIKYFRTDRDIRNNNRVLRLAKRTDRVFVIYVDRDHKNGGEGRADFVKHGRIYNPAFDCDYCLDWPHLCGGNRSPEYGASLQELIDQGFNLKYCGRPGDGKEAYWNNHDNNHIDLVVQMRLLTR